MKNNHDKKSRQRGDYELVGESIRIFVRGGVWHANFQRDGRQHRQSLKTRSKKEARRRAIRLEAQLLAGELPRPSSMPTLAAAVEKYRAFLKNEGRAKKTLQKYDKVFQRLQALADKWRVTKVSGVNLELVDAYKARRVDDQAAAKTIYTETVVIRQLVNFALTRKLITADPLGELKLKKPKPRPQPCWTKEEVQEILAACHEPQRMLLTILAETGMRVGELKHLTWDDVDFLRGVILIQEKVGWKPKTGDQRAIPMSPAARAVLEKLPRKAQWVFTAAPSRRYPKGDHQVSERRLLDYLKRVLKRLGFKGHVHTFRHAFISNALTQGIPEAIVRQWVGHVDPEVIKLYTHIADQASQAAMRRLAEAGNQTPAQAGKEAKNERMEGEANQAQIKHADEEGQNGQSAKRKPPTG
jgi:site-specific recombinase XerD